MLVNALVISLIVLFLKATTWKGHIFEIFGDEKLFEVTNKYGEKATWKFWKPLFGCNICMTPWHGLWIYIVAWWTEIQGFSDLRIQTILFTLFIASGFSAIWYLLSKIPNEIQDLSNIIKDDRQS